MAKILDLPLDSDHHMDMQIIVGYKYHNVHSLFGEVHLLNYLQLFEGLEICGKSVTKQQNSPDDTTDNTDYCSPDGDASRIHCHKDLDLIEEER